MTNINFSSYIDQQFAAQAAASQNGTSVGAGAGDGQINFPYANPETWSGETSFDTSIPRNPDGSIDFNALLEKLREMLYYSSQGDQMDFNSMLDIMAYLMNIGGVWGQLSSSQQSQLTQYLNLPFGNTGQSLLQAISKDLVTAAIYGNYYQNNGKDNGFTSQLMSTLQGLISGGASFLSPLLTEAQTLPLPTNSSMTFDEFTLTMSIQWETDFSMNDNTANYMDGWRSNELQDLLGQPGVAKNPFLAYILIMYILMNENGDLQTQIGGRGNLINSMTGLGKDAQQMSSQWSAGNFLVNGQPNAQAAQSFYQELQNLYALAQDKRFSSILPQIQQLWNDMTNPNSQVTVDVDGTEMSVGQLYQDIINKVPNPHNNNQPYSWSDMAEALNTLQPSTCPPNGNSAPVPTPAGYTTLANDIGQVATSVTNASSAQGQIVQNEEGVNEQNLSFITATANELVDVEKVITQNMASAGN